MRSFLKIVFPVLPVLLLVSCQKDLDELEKYTPPEWLKGKLYSQIEAQEGLDLFAEALRLTGLDTIVNTSGLFTVFAPDNDAVEAFLGQNSAYGGALENVPVEELREIVSYHIVQNSWSKRQLASLNLDGWIDPSEEEVTSRAFKKETFLRPQVREYHVLFDEETGYRITREETGTTRKVYSQSRKYVPVYFREYFDTYGLPVSDYAFYFGRPFEGDLYFAGARILNEEEIPAENGYVYIIDRLVEPLPTAEEILEGEYNGYAYTDFLDLVYEFPEFTPNLDATYQQEGASTGQNVDTLFNLGFPDLAVNFTSEITSRSGSNSLGNIQYHNTVIAPTNQAFNVFLDTYVRGNRQWGSLDNLPRSVKRILVNSYMVDRVIYDSDIASGFRNAENDMLWLEESRYVQKTFASNACFFGLNEAIVPRAFSSVSAPVYLRRGFFTFMTIIEETNVLDALKREGQEYSLFVIPDEFGGMLRDSSVSIRERNNNISFRAFNRSTLRMENLPKNDLRKMILNHVGLSTPTGIPSKEYIENMAGNFIVFDHVNNVVSGPAATSYGFQGDSLIDVEAIPLEEDTDNGKTYQIPTWFSFSRNPMNLLIFQVNPRFMDLLEEAGMARRIIGDEFELSFLNQGTSYTAFIPTQEALGRYDTDTLTQGELEQFLRNHFITNELLFTDGRIPSGHFQTTNRGTSQVIRIETGPDLLSIRDRTGNEITRVDPLTEFSNSMTTSTIGNANSGSEWNFITTGVVHAIDTVLISGTVY